MSDYLKFRGKCKELSEAACAEDPSLALVRGHYYCPIWNVTEPHWWTVRPDEWQEMFEEADYMRYDAHATRAFWVCYAIILIAVTFFCYILWS